MDGFSIYGAMELIKRLEFLTQQQEKLMSGFLDIKREVGETTAQVAQVAASVSGLTTSVADLTTRVQQIIAQLPPSAELAALNTQLNEQQAGLGTAVAALDAAKTQLDNLAKPA